VDVLECVSCGCPGKCIVECEEQNGACPNLNYAYCFPDEDTPPTNEGGDSPEDSEEEACQFCGNDDRMSPNVETLVIGFGFCRFCCEEQRSHQCTYSDVTDEWMMKGDKVE
jgi:hypothetical protein